MQQRMKFSSDSGVTRGKVLTQHDSCRELINYEEKFVGAAKPSIALGRKLKNLRQTLSVIN